MVKASKWLEYCAAPPSSMIVGNTYTCSVTVTNQSTKAGVPAAYTFNVSILIKVGTTVVFSATNALSLAAGASAIAGWTFTIPAANTGSGFAQVTLFDANKTTQLAQTPQATFMVTSSTTPPPGSAPVPAAFASIKDKLVRAWVLRDSTWFMYDPADLIGSNLTYVETGEVISISVTQDCTLTYGGKSWQLKAGWNNIKW